MVAYLQILRIIFLTCISIFYVSANLQSIIVREDTSRRDMILVDDSLVETKTKSLSRCVNRCIQTDSCMSMFYHSQSLQCVLNQFWGSDMDSKQLTNSDGWKYYQKVGELSREKNCLASGFQYEPSIDVCFIVETIPHDFDAAKQHCDRLNSQLIRVTSQTKQDWLREQLTANGVEWACIQGNNSGSPVYQFDNGAPLGYTAWHTVKGQPESAPNYYIKLHKFCNRWHSSPKVEASKVCLIVCEKQ